MNKFESIRPFFDAEVNDAIHTIIDDPMLEAMMSFTFPNDSSGHWKDQMLHTHSLRDFQINFIYHGVKKVLEKSSDGLSFSGFDALEPNTPYLFISNHRDIILDTSLLNTCLYENGLVLTTSAIGDNLVKKPFLHILSKLNRNFLIRRGLKGKELFESSHLASSYIQNSLLHENRSVWTAQREGRTKDGKDATHKGVLKMITLADPRKSSFEIFKEIKVVPISISYEYDPTDVLKMPELLAKSRDEIYVKSENEDFLNLLRGIMGTKKRIHIEVNGELTKEITEISNQESNLADKLGSLADVIDHKIWAGYKLWPSNYIAHDLIHEDASYSSFYSEEQKAAFVKRFEEKVNSKDPIIRSNFLSMYANPVDNKEKTVQKIPVG